MGSSELLGSCHSAPIGGAVLIRRRVNGNRREQTEPHARVFFWQSGHIL